MRATNIEKRNILHGEKSRTMSESPAFNLLTSHAYPEVAAALAARREAAVRALYETIVRKTVPKADDLTINQLRDDLPRIIDYLADMMATAAQRGAREFFEATAKHGLVRYYQNFDPQRDADRIQPASAPDIC